MCIHKDLLSDNAVFEMCKIQGFGKSLGSNGNLTWANFGEHGDNTLRVLCCVLCVVCVVGVQ